MSNLGGTSHSEWDNANLYSRWTFSVANKMLRLGETKPLEFDDLMRQPSADYTAKRVQRLVENWSEAKRIWYIPRIMVAMIRSHAFEMMILVFYTMVEGAIRVALPVLLNLLLIELQSGTTSRAYVYAGILSGLGVAQTLVHHILFFYSMKVGWNCKIESTGLIYDRLFMLQSKTLSGNQASTGKLVNLISNDVARFEICVPFLMFSWCSLLELGAILGILITILDAPSGCAGVFMTLLFIPIQIYLAQKLAFYRAKAAVCTDHRVRYISEIIDGIASVKGYAWETPFFKLIRTLRKEEVGNVQHSQSLKAINQGLYYCTPAIASFAMFAVFWGMGGLLTIPKVFASMSLLQTLRMSIGRQWTLSIETLSEAVASAHRIENFLSMAEGATKAQPQPASSTSASSSAITSTANTRAIATTPKTLHSSGSDDATMNIEMTATPNSETLYSVADKSYSYGESNAEPALKNISFSLMRGELLMVIGPVGAGKSSLLLSMLEEMQEVGDMNNTSSSNSSDKGNAPNYIDRANTKKDVSLPRTKIALCAQRPWITASSIRANVTLAGGLGANSTEADIKAAEKLYALAMNSCCLVPDLMGFPALDDTEIGERGISISGGQKARIALARAVYSDACVCLLDDPLSACDASVGRALFFNCILEALRKRGKGVVLATHQLQYLKFADKILVLNDQGVQVYYGDYTGLQAARERFPFLDLDSKSSIAVNGSTDNLGAMDADTDTNIEKGVTSPSTPSQQLQDADAGGKDDATSSPSSPNTPSSQPQPKLLTFEALMSRNQQNKAAKALEGGGKDEESKEKDKAASRLQLLDERRRIIVQPEDRVEGRISFSLCWQYIKSGGTVKGIFALSMALIGQVLIMIDDYWLRWWASSTFGPQSDNRYVGVFALLAALCVFLGFYRAQAWFQFTLGAASMLHEQALWSVTHSPLSFYIANPTGRILNRFSRDQNQSDESLPVTLFEFLQCSLFCLAGIVLVCVSIPWLVLMLPPLCYFFVMARTKYMKSTREIKRLEAVTRSPIYADFSATLEGLQTLRAYRLQESATRKFHKQLDDNGRVFWSFLMCSRWLGFRLDVESAIVLILICILSVALRDSVDVGLIGFALVYTLALSGLLQWTVRQSAEVEAQFTSVERLAAYAQLPPESGYRTTLASLDKDKDNEKQQGESGYDKHGGSRAGGGRGGAYDAVAQGDQDLSKPTTTTTTTTPSPPPPLPLPPPRTRTLRSASNGTSFPVVPKVAGKVSIRQLTVRYREDLDPVLQGFSLEIPAGCKVGVVGRTGSGKSSLLMALLRLNMITAGSIFIDDDLSLLDMSLEDARSVVTVIPQEPHLFSGTVRFNLDPFQTHSDEEIWEALRNAHVAETLSKDPLGLAQPVSEGGKNFSVGQRQLLSLARAILRRSQVILMDEVTASIDYVTDRLIQETIRTCAALKDATIITVAHRLRTIADCDIVVVVGDGGVAEKGLPSSLLRQSDSHFRALAVESEELEEITRLADEKASSVSLSPGPATTTD